MQFMNKSCVQLGRQKFTVEKIHDHGLAKQRILNAQKFFIGINFSYPSSQREYFLTQTFKK